MLLKQVDMGANPDKKKLLIFDMDETLVAAKFEGGVPKDFVETFNF